MLSSKFVRHIANNIVSNQQQQSHHHHHHLRRLVAKFSNKIATFSSRRFMPPSPPPPPPQSTISTMSFTSSSSPTAASGLKDLKKKNGNVDDHHDDNNNNSNNNHRIAGGGDDLPDRKHRPPPPHHNANGHNGNHNNNSKDDAAAAVSEYSLTEIREQLRQCDPADSDGRLVLTMDDQTGIATLCISSPARKNAFSGFMMAQFSDLLDQLEQWTQGQMILLYGADNFFCSGADLKTIRHNKLPPDQCGAHFISALMHSNLTRLERLSLVSVALIEGKALGGGAEIITACDFRVALPDAQIGFVHAKLGVTPGFGGGTRLLRLVGATNALKLMLSARLIDAAEAFELGLVQHLLEPGVRGQDAVRAAIEWYRGKYGAITPIASRAIKSIVAGSIQNQSTEWALKREANIFCSVWGREEHMKALASNIKHHK